MLLELQPSLQRETVVGYWSRFYKLDALPLIKSTSSKQWMGNLTNFNEKLINQQYFHTAYSNTNALTWTECADCWIQNDDTEPLGHSSYISLSHGPTLCLWLRLIATHNRHTPDTPISHWKSGIDRQLIARSITQNHCQHQLKDRRTLNFKNKVQK